MTEYKPGMKLYFLNDNADIDEIEIASVETKTEEYFEITTTTNQVIDDFGPGGDYCITRDEIVSAGIAEYSEKIEYVEEEIKDLEKKLSVLVIDRDCLKAKIEKLKGHQNDKL